MVLDNPSISHFLTRTLWPLPTLVLPGALAISFLAPDTLGGYWTASVVVLALLQIGLSFALWKCSARNQNQLEGVREELSSLQSIVEVSRDAIIGVTNDGIII